MTVGVRRRSLGHVGGPVVAKDGASRDRERLARALEVDPRDEEAARAHIHGFHSYPARLHPLVAKRLVEDFGAKDATVLDPFCGSGTVLIETRLAGRRALGVDANPIAVALSALKASGLSEAQRRELTQAATAIARETDERRRGRAGASRRYEREDMNLFEPHILLELDGLRFGIEHLADGPTRRALWLVLSSILTKVSRQPGDTGENLRPQRRLAGGFTARLFLDKANELAKRFAQYEALLPQGAPVPKVKEGDARRLDDITRASIDLVVTSPPYPGNYDYLSHHVARLRWLGLPLVALEKREIGSRRKLQATSFDRAVATWRQDLVLVFSALRRVCRPSGSIVLVIADSVVSRRAIPALDVTRDAASRAGLAIAASASQDRPHFHQGSFDAFRDRPRREHVILMHSIP